MDACERVLTAVKCRKQIAHFRIYLSNHSEILSGSLDIGYKLEEDFVDTRA